MENPYAVVSFTCQFFQLGILLDVTWGSKCPKDCWELLCRNCAWAAIYVGVENIFKTYTCKLCAHKAMTLPKHCFDFGILAQQLRQFQVGRLFALLWEFACRSVSYRLNYKQLGT